MRAALVITIACWPAILSVSQDHLSPEPGILAKEDDYYLKLRDVFAEVYRSKVVLQVVLIPSFQAEEIVGIRKTDKGFEAFAPTPSSSVWSTYNIWAIESGEQCWKDEHGHDIPLEKNPTLADLKSHAPSDFRLISVHTDSRPISARPTERIERVWQKMLLDAQHPKNPGLGADGETYHFSMWIRMHGIVSGEVWSPSEGKTLALTNLAKALANYAKGHADEDSLSKLLKSFEP